MATDRVDFTIMFRKLSDFSTAERAKNDSVRDLFLRRDAFDAWANRYRQRLTNDGSDDTARSIHMRQVNPKYILRNYLAEIAIRRAEDDKDYSEIDQLFTLLQSPFEEHPDWEHYAGHPPDWANQLSVSCSS